MIAKPVTIRGQEFPSTKAAAAHFGVTPSAISVAKRRGALDQVTGGGGYRKPCSVAGVNYPSRSAAATALGVKVDYVVGHLIVCRAAGTQP